MTTERGKRGKDAEKQVTDLLTTLNERADLAWHRMPDSRAARGMIGAQPADFIVADAGKTRWWEVKELAHPYRIARDKVSQRPTLHKFRMAGMDYIVITYHTEDRVWRVVPGQWLDAHSGGASWVLDKFKTYVTVEDALRGEGFL